MERKQIGKFFFMKLAPNKKNLLHSSMLFWFWLSWLVLAIPSWLFCLTILPWHSYPGSYLLDVWTWLSSPLQPHPGCLVLAVLSFAAPSWLSCPGCPLLCSPILAVLSWLSSPLQPHPGCLVLAALSWLSCFGCLFLTSWLAVSLSCPGSLIATVLSWLFLIVTALLWYFSPKCFHTTNKIVAYRTTAQINNRLSKEFLVAW